MKLVINHTTVLVAFALLWTGPNLIFTKPKDVSSTTAKRGIPVERRNVHDNSTSKTTISTFLHIPKTGTSFELEILHYLCQPENSSQLDQLFDQVAQSIGSPKPCTEPIKPGHKPLKTSTKPEETVTLVRHPVKRLASGLLHNFHDCHTLRRKMGIKKENQGPEFMQQQFCPHIERLLEQKNATHKGVSRAKQMIQAYIQCASGCSTKMLLGKPCGSSLGKITYHTPKVVEQTLESLLFVGVTDRWEETICSWRNQFQASKPYPPTRNTRQTPLKECEHNLVQVLNRDYTMLTSKDPDWAVYNKGLQLFQERLPSHCSSNNNNSKK